MAGPLRLMIYDATCTGRRIAPGLSHAWWIGGHLYRSLGRIDHARGASRWGEALRWAVDVEDERPIGEVQLWMHGRWGRALLERDSLDLASLGPGHPHRALLSALRERLSPPSVVWFRTCETFGAAAGQRFARMLADFLGCRVAGHTHVISDWQSGLHSLRPGEAPRWSPDEGLLEGSADAPRRACWSAPWRPRTIHCLTGAVPEGW